MILSSVLDVVFVVRGERAAKPKKQRVSLMWMGFMRVPM